MSGLPKAEHVAYLDARAAAVISDEALRAWEEEWSPRLAVHGLGLDLLPLGQPNDDIPLTFDDAASGPDEPPIEWEGLGVIQPVKAPPGLPEVDLMDFIAGGDDDDDQEWLVEGLIPKGGLTILGGNPKTGKTLFALDLCISVATGRPFFGRETQSTAFMFVTEEGTPGEMRKRFRRLVGSSGVPTKPGKIVHRKGIRFDDPRTWQLVRDAIGRLDQPVLLVLDPLRDLLVGDENDSNTIATVSRAVHAILRDYDDVTVVLLHHLTKRGEGAGGARLRGSSALWGTADCTLILDADPIPDDMEAEVDLRGKVYVEPRNGQRGRFFWRWDVETGLFIESAAEAKTLVDKASALLFTEGPQTTRDLAAALETTADVIRHSLGRDSRFRSQPGERPHDPSTWELVP